MQDQPVFKVDDGDQEEHEAGQDAGPESPRRWSQETQGGRPGRSSRFDDGSPPSASGAAVWATATGRNVTQDTGPMQGGSCRRAGWASRPTGTPSQRKAVGEEIDQNAQEETKEESGHDHDDGLYVAISCQLSAISYQLSAVSRQPSAVSHQPSAVSRQPGAYQLPVTRLCRSVIARPRTSSPKRSGVGGAVAIFSQRLGDCHRPAFPSAQSASL